MNNLPFITVVMPVRNEARFIGSTLRQLLEQDYPADRFEVIVADGLSGDATRDIVREVALAHPNVRLVENPARRSSAGRNLGFRLGRGDVFLVVDGHCLIPGRDHLRKVAECLDESGADCLGRPQHLDPPDITGLQRSIALARASWLGHGGGSLIYGGFEGFASPVSNGAAYTRRVFERVGYVDEAFDACEDVEFNWRVERAGLTSYTSPRLTVKYYPRESLGGLWRQMVRYGRGRVRLARKHPATLGLTTAVPACVAAFWAVYLLILAARLAVGSAAPVLDASLRALSVPAALYVLVLLGESLRISLGHGFSHMARLPLAFATVHLGLGTGMWLELAAPAGRRA